MKSATISMLFVLVASLGVLLCNQPAESQDQQQAAPDNRINSLLAERRETLRQLVDAITARYTAGHRTLDNVIHARNGLLDAELEMAKTSAERIQIHEDRVQNFRALENAVKQRHKAGQATIDEMLVAKAARLEAEIELLRE